MNVNSNFQELLVDAKKSPHDVKVSENWVYLVDTFVKNCRYEINVIFLLEIHQRFA